MARVCVGASAGDGVLLGPGCGACAGRAVEVVPGCASTLLRGMNVTLRFFLGASCVSEAGASSYHPRDLDPDPVTPCPPPPPFSKISWKWVGSGRFHCCRFFEGVVRAADFIVRVNLGRGKGDGWGVVWGGQVRQTLHFVWENTSK